MTNQSVSPDTERSRRIESMLANPWLSLIHPMLRWLNSSPGLEHINGPENSGEPPAFVELTQFTGTPEVRLAGFHKVYGDIAPLMEETLPLYGPALKVLNPQYLEAWREHHGHLPPAYLAQLHREAAAFLDHDTLNHSAAIRRSFMVDGQSVGGPTRNDLRTPEQIVDNIVGPKGFFQFLQLKGYLDNPDTNLNLFLQEWIDPLNIESAHGNVAKLPAGGNAYIESVRPDGSLIVVVKACLGENSGPDQGHPEVDTYRMLYTPPSLTGTSSPTGQTEILKRNIFPQRTVCRLQRMEVPSADLHATRVTTNDGSDSDLYDFPVDPTTSIATSLFRDEDLLRVATVVGMLYATNNNTPHKVEFTKGNFRAKSGNGLVESVAILEAIPTHLPEHNGHEVVLYPSSQLRLTLEQESDIDRLEELIPTWTESHPLVYLAHSLVRQFTARPHLLERLKKVRRLTIVGSFSHTAHKTNELERTHNLFRVTPVSIETGLNYTIKRKGGLTYLELDHNHLSKHAIPDVITLQQARILGLVEASIIGGKGVGLVELDVCQFFHPPTAFITKAGYQAILEANNLGHLPARIAQATNARELRHLFAIIHRNLKRIPPHIVSAIQETMSEPFINGEEYELFLSAFRSDASFEDHRDHPFAGRMLSKLFRNIKIRREIRRAVLTVLRSYFNPEQNIAEAIFTDVAPRSIKDILAELGGEVILQPMVKNIVASGTIFGREITGRKDPNIVVLQANLGVAGSVDGDDRRKQLTVHFNTSTQMIESITVTDGEKETALTLADLTQGRAVHILHYNEILGLVKLAEFMSKKMNGPRDAEWALNDKGKIIFLQSRPL